MREWKPGDVAMVTRDDGTETSAIMRHDGTWRVVDACVNNPPRAFRPLVVIDPEDREQVARLADAFCTARWSHTVGSDECDPLTRSSMKEALDAYLTPPKPDEPQGLGAVVEDAAGRQWVRGHRSEIAPWMRVWVAGESTEPSWRYWAGIDAVKILSDGVQP